MIFVGCQWLLQQSLTCIGDQELVYVFDICLTFLDTFAIVLHHFISITITHIRQQIAFLRKANLFQAACIF